MWISKRKFKEEIEQARKAGFAEWARENERLENDLKWYKEHCNAKEKSITTLEQQVRDLKAQVRDQTTADMTLEALKVLKSAMGDGKDVLMRYEAMKEHQNLLINSSIMNGDPGYNHGLLYGSLSGFRPFIW